MFRLFCPVPLIVRTVFIKGYLTLWTQDMWSGTGDRFHPPGSGMERQSRRSQGATAKLTTIQCSSKAEFKEAVFAEDCLKDAHICVPLISIKYTIWFSQIFRMLYDIIPVVSILKLNHATLDVINLCWEKHSEMRIR